MVKSRNFGFNIFFFTKVPLLCLGTPIEERAIHSIHTASESESESEASNTIDSSITAASCANNYSIPPKSLPSVGQQPSSLTHSELQLIDVMVHNNFNLQQM